MVEDKREMAHVGRRLSERVCTIEWRMISHRQLKGNPLPGPKRNRVLEWAEYEFCRVRSQSIERNYFGDLSRFSHRLFITKTDSDWNCLFCTSL